MVIENTEESQKNKISVGLILSNDDLKSNPIFPKEVINELVDTAYYLFIFISREDGIKISCFPTKTNNIKKILIKLKEFSNDLVQGIADILKKLNLNKEILHTTGVCYEMENCFYETYLIGDNMSLIDSSTESIKEKFMSIVNIINVSIEDIPTI